MQISNPSFRQNEREREREREKESLALHLLAQKMGHFMLFLLNLIALSKNSFHIAFFISHFLTRLRKV
jgi:hypothetical protein